MNETDPANIAWKKRGADIVVESTGKFKDHKSASKHFGGRCQEGVVITAPGRMVMLLLLGVNEETYDPDGTIEPLNGPVQRTAGSVNKVLQPNCSRYDDDRSFVYE